MKKLPLIFAFALSVLVGPALAVLSAVPPNIISTAQNKPMVMLTASKDFTMFWKAYTDFEDIDFDGVIDYTYKPTFSYYGYFDPDKCYTYSTANDGRFEPHGDVSIAAADVGKHYCAAGAGLWSGNFLNWSTMSRMDVLRKVLYGGLRSYNGATQALRYTNGDTSSDTTLEESFVPRNSQAFVKYYNGTDVDRVTPFNSDDARNKGITLCRRAAENTGTSHTSLFTPQIRVAIGNVALWNMTEVRTCNWSNEINYTWKAATLEFLTSNYVTPIGSTGTSNSAYVHGGSVPVLATDGASYTSGGTSVGPNFTARVQVCVAGMLDPGCKQYVNEAASVYKPTGLLHEFGESTSSGSAAARAEFGLMMGSYDHNLEAGVLRKNISEINDEITPTTGQFRLSGGIIQSLSEITLYGYNASSGNYSENCHSDTISNGQCPSWGNPVGELLLESTRYYAGKAAQRASGAKDLAVGLTTTTWVDPLSSVSDNTVINSGLKRHQLYGRGICRPLNMITISGGINSFDNNLITTGFNDITATTTAAALTKNIGDQEGITGTTRLVGKSGASADLQCTPKTVSDLGEVEGICPDGPNFKGTYLGAGIAHYANTRRIRADKNAIANEIPDLPYNAMTVRNYAVSMSGGTANIEVPMPGNAQCAQAKGGLANAACPRVYITPSSLDALGPSNSLRAPALPGNLVDFKILSSSVDASGFATGSALVLWQHSMLGEDQDQDQLGSIRWQVGGTAASPTLTIHTQAIEADTGSIQPYGFGYTIAGTTDSDGLHMHSGINNYTVTTTGVSVSNSASTSTSSCPPTTGGSPSTKLCSIVKINNVDNYVRGETYKTFAMRGTSSATLNEPLWYAAKYGGFKYTKEDQTAANGTNFYPTRLNQWDRKKETGAPCLGTEADPCDGVPDNYFYARRPDLLSNSLREILEDIVTSSNTAPAIASSQLQEGDLKVVATFDAGDGSGALRSYALSDDGTFAAVGNETWNAHTLLTQTAASERQVITNQPVSGVSTGVAFTWASLSEAKKTALKGDTGTDTDAEKMVDWLRGDKTYADEFRTRSAASILGPVVNSNPTVQKRPNARYVGSRFSGYGAFASSWSDRRLLLWVGAGDGMLHAFDGSNTSLGGRPVLSFIPDPVFANLRTYASINGAKVQSFVDGSPFVGDVKVDGSWATYLFSSLGRGGKGIFALDVTKAGTVTTDAGNVATVSNSELDQAHAASIFKWQLTEADEPDDLGYIISEPKINRVTNQPGQIAMMNNGRFAVLFGNGVESKKGNAALFIVFADGSAEGNGGKYKKLVVPTISAADCTPPDTPYAGYCNGLSQVTWVDTNNDRVADYIYAGDLKGNLWRFDVTSNDAANWSVSYREQPLFTAVDSEGNALPITGAPETRYHPMGGVMVGVVTGAAVYAADFPNISRTHAVFGIWDNPNFTDANYATPSAMAEVLPRSLNDLAIRTLVNVDSDGNRRYVTGDAIDWATKKGWVMPLNVSSEMGLNNLTIANSQLLTVTVSPAPAKAGTDSDPCTDTPVARLVGVDPITGLPSGLLGSAEVIASNDDKSPSAIPNYMTVVLASIQVNDQKGQFVSDLVGRDSTQAGCANGSLSCTAYEGAYSGPENPRLASGLGWGRIFWREIPGFKTR